MIKQLVALTLLVCGSGSVVDDKPSPIDCPEGKLRWAGLYLVSTLVELSNCIVVGHDAEVHLDAPLRLHHVLLQGSITFFGAGNRNNACIKSSGLNITGNHTRIIFRDCSSGRCLHESTGVVQHGGFSAFLNCPRGGMYAENYVQLARHAVMNFEDCRAGVGGGLYTPGKLHVDKTSALQARRCTAVDGGAVQTGDLFSEGHLHFEDCWARDWGGALRTYKRAIISGKAVFRNSSSGRRGACSLEGGGGKGQRYQFLFSLNHLETTALRIFSGAWY